MSDLFGGDSFASLAEELADEMEEQRVVRENGADIASDADGLACADEAEAELAAAKKEILKNLNQPQQEAILTTEGPVLVLAGAGSGKTTVLTRRIAWILRSGLAKSYQILGVTFTNKAARELSDRLRRMCNIAHFANVGTFHSVCSRWLRREAERLGISPNFTIYDGSAQKMLMTSVLKELNMDIKKYPPKRALALVSHYKNDGRRPVGLSRSSDPLERRMADIYELYNRKLRENEALDFDDILVYTVRLFRDYPEVLAMYTERIKYILVDEYQDVNAVQYELLRLLAGQKRNICAVGDDDQSIYKFRGADLSIILRFAEDFADGRTIKLEQNYRSTQAILDLANDVIRLNKGRTGKKLWSEHSGRKPVVYGARTAYDEAEFAARTIQTLMDNQGYGFGDFAVLYRANAMSRVFEEVFLRWGLVHKVVGGQRFYERAEVKDLLVFFSIFINFNDSVALQRILENTPGVGATTRQKMVEWSLQNERSLYDTLEYGDILGLRKTTAETLRAMHGWIGEMAEKVKQRITLTKLLTEVIEHTNYRETLRKRCDSETEYAGRIENVDELISTVASFDASYQGSSIPLEAFMAEVSLYSDQDDYDSEPDRITLMTVHTSKGLEFPVVFLVGMEENTLPSYLSLQTGSNDDIEEERRLCYVGMTRAKQRLFLSFACKRDKQGIPYEYDVSRFLFDANPECYDCGNQLARQLLSDDRAGVGKALGQGGGAYGFGSSYGSGAGGGPANSSRCYASQDAHGNADGKKRQERKRVYDTLKGLEETVTRRSAEEGQWVSTWGTNLGSAAYADAPEDVSGSLRRTMTPRQKTSAKRSAESQPLRSMNDRYREVREKFPIGATVSHKLFGLGTVAAVDHSFVKVRFSNHSERLLTADVLTVEKLPAAEDPAAASAEEAAVPRRPARVGDWVEVPIFGRGIIQDAQGDKFVVAFGGVKRCMDKQVVQNLWQKQS